ncbi:MAG: lipoprotein [Crocinitomicaceae bacterium]
MKKSILLGLMSLMIIGHTFAQSAVWAKTTVSNSFENRALDIDSDENVYIAGSFGGIVEFDPSLGTFDSDGDIYVQKLDSAGNFEWVTILGADDDLNAPHDDVQDILVDDQGNSYVSGTFVDTTQFWATHIYLVKLDSDGTVLWEHTLGSGGGGQMTFAADGGLLVTGFFNDTTDFDPDSTNEFELYPSNGDMFILKLNPNGMFEWVKQLGAYGGFAGAWSYPSIEIDDAGMIYLGGGFSDTFDINPGTAIDQYIATPQVNPFDQDMYLLKLDENANYVWSHHFEGLENDNIRDIQIVNGHIVIQGSITNQVDVDPDPIDENIVNGNWGRNGFILSLSLDGEFEWVNLYNATMLVLDTDQGGNVYSYGWIDEVCDFSQTSTPNQVTPLTDENLYILQLDSLGEFLEVANYDDQAIASAWLSMRRSQDGDFYILGNSSGSLFGLLPNISNMTFVAKLSSVPGQNSVLSLTHAQVVLSPNPTMDLVTIIADIEIDEICVRDIRGKEVFRSESSTFDLSAHDSGVYYVTMISGNAHFTMSVVKE